MIVAYDLRYACDHFPGIGAHAYELLESLLEAGGEERYLVLWNPVLANTRFDLERLKSHPRVTWVERQFSPLGLGGLVRTGLWLRGSGAGVYLSPFHLAPIGAGIPCVVTVHDVRPLRHAGGLNWWKRRVVRLGLRSAARARTIIAISEFSRREIEQTLGLRDGIVRTVRSGIRSRRTLAHESKPPGMPEGDFALVVGDNRPHKNLELLARAWASLERRCALSLVSVGPQHPRYPGLDRMSVESGARRVYCLGWLGGEQLEWLYRRARMLLLPSLYEGFGIPMVEAFAHGVPVLAADIPVLREIGGEIPRFVDPMQPAAWADEIARLDADAGARERMRAAGLACEGQPSYRDSARATLEVVRDSVGGPPGAAPLIAYDLRFAEDGFTGIGTHAYSLLEALLRIPGDERYLVLWNAALQNSRFDFDPIRLHPRVRWVERDFAPRAVSALWKVGRLLREFEVDVYLSPFYFMPLGCGCPCVLTLHDVLPLRWPQGTRFWPRALYQLSLARATQARFVLTASEFSRREIEELSALGSDHLRVVKLGIPSSHGRRSPHRPRSLPDGPFALVVGVNKPHKNLATLAAAWGRFADTPPLRLVGAGPVDPRHPGLERLAGPSAAGAVTSLGRMGEDELEWLYRNATLLLFPTLYEGFGLPMVEAFAHGVPVVASDIPTLREVGEGAARFVEPLDSASWAREVRTLALDPGARQTMADAGRARAAELTYERTARGTLAVLREAAGVTSAVVAGAPA